jgi:deoxyribodipyrimidine photo-lyase
MGGEGEAFLRELVWREFSWHLLVQFPELPEQPLRSEFAEFPWQAGQDETVAVWQKGQTGFPIIDAGMRQLWQTGWMHNRVRMIVASFLVKDMLWHWRAGEDWFWDTLVDADLANNAASWQWVAGCGADAAPYFRIFNPILQGEKFDRAGDYVRQFVPELSGLPNKYIHKPFEAPEEVLKAAGVTLGETYPRPIVDRAAARKRALGALESIKK